MARETGPTIRRAPVSRPIGLTDPGAAEKLPAPWLASVSGLPEQGGERKQSPAGPAQAAERAVVNLCPAGENRAYTMSDFFQTGAIATLHRLGTPDVARLERELTEFAREMPIALILPCHVRELGTKALRLIVRELKAVPYLRQVVVGLDGATRRSDFERARRLFAQLPQSTVLLWNDGPRMKALFEHLEEADLSAGPGGKGRNVWICLGYVLASEQARMVAVHDCDLLTYNREMLARLV